MNVQSANAWARAAGVLFVVSMLGGFFGEIYVPTKLIVHDDAAATAANLKASDFLHRAGFAAYLIEALCDTALSLILYVLLRPVQKDVALLAAFIGIVATATFAIGELFYFSSGLVLRDVDYLRSFSVDQRNTLALLSLKTYALCSGVFMAFYGTAWMVRAYLVYRSRYLPRFLGILLGLGGLGFATRSFLYVLAPNYASNLLLLPLALGALILAVILLTRGVDRREWEGRLHAHA